MTPIDLIITLGFFPGVILLVTLLVAVPVWWRANASRGWLTTRGNIISSAMGVSPAPRAYWIKVPDVRYEYEVAGKQYEGRTVRFAYAAYHPADTVAWYHAGEQVTVYYNSRSPKQSVLIPGMQPGDVRRAMYPFLIALAVLTAGWLA
jgi:hypothetical protein